MLAPWKKVKVKVKSCLTLCNPMDCSLPSFPIHGVFQARILEWVAISFSRGSSPPRGRTQVSSIAGRCFTLWATREAMTNLDRILKSRDITDKGLSSQSYGFSSSHVWMWELDYKKSWVPKNWCFWNVVLEKTLESLLDCKEIQSVHSKGDQS